MDKSLVALIEQFREAQNRGVAFIADVLGSTLGVRLPKTQWDWLNICTETGLYNVRWVNGVTVYSHGYGIELIFGSLTIDFDWGDHGEPDGFDTWRLWNFARLNPCNFPCPSFSLVRSWLEEAEATGELTTDHLLYYSPKHRAPRERLYKCS